MYRVEGYLTIHLDDDKAAEALYKALLGDIKDIPKSRRGNVEVEIKEKQVELHVKAPDLSAARALINSYSYLIFSMLSALEAVKGGGREDTS